MGALTGIYEKFASTVTQSQFVLLLFRFLEVFRVSDSIKQRSSLQLVLQRSSNRIRFIIYITMCFINDKSSLLGLRIELSSAYSGLYRLNEELPK